MKKSRGKVASTQPPEAPHAATNLRALDVAQLRVLREHVTRRLAEIDAAMKRHGEAPPTDTLLVSRPVLARLLGVHQDTITRFTSDGMPVHAPGHRNQAGEYDAVVCCTWWRSRKMDGGEAAKARRERSQADLNEHRLHVARGDYIPRAELATLLTPAVAAIRAGLLALPRATAPQLARAARQGVDAVESVLAAKVRELLTALSTVPEA